MTALVCGSVAYDTVMVFDGRFRDHILPERLHVLNVSFLVPAMRRNYGGCAGNIAYNLGLLGGEGRVMATVGRDFAPYREWFERNRMPLDHVLEIPDEFTAQAFITTDLESNQITAFHPGAMAHAARNAVPRDRGYRLGHVGPESRDGMLAHAEQFSAAGIPFLFDPGQGLPMFDGEELRRFIELSSWVAANDYEGSLLVERTGLALDAIAERVEALVITRGGEGSWIWAGGARHDIPAVKPATIADPTGCGDAYRAGLLHGLQRGFDWPTTGRIASLMGSMKIEQHGTQNHRFTSAAFSARFQQSFGARLD